MTDEKADDGPVCNCLTCRMEESVRQALVGHLDEKPNATEVAEALARVLARIVCAAEEAKGAAGFFVIIQTFFNEFNANVRLMRSEDAPRQTDLSVH